MQAAIPARATSTPSGTISPRAATASPKSPWTDGTTRRFSGLERGEGAKWGGFVDGVDEFDPLFFNISPREAPYMDPQERLFLQCAYEAIEDAGYTRAALAEGDVGVFVGVMWEEYQLYGAERTVSGEAAGAVQ